MQNMLLARKRFGLTQTQLANYLSVSESLIKLVEINRRSLPTPALLKLTALEMMNLSESASSDELMREGFPETNNYLDKMAEQHYFQEKKLRRQLEMVQAKYQQVRNCQHLIAQLGQQLTEGENDTKDLLWLAALKAEVNIRLERCSPAAQALLQWKIDCLEFSVASAKALSGEK